MFRDFSITLYTYYIFLKTIKTLVLWVRISANFAVSKLYAISKIIFVAFETPHQIHTWRVDENIVLTAHPILIVALVEYTWRHRTADPSRHTPTRTFDWQHSSRVVWRNAKHTHREREPRLFLYALCALTYLLPTRCENRSDAGVYFTVETVIINTCIVSARLL